MKLITALIDWALKREPAVAIAGFTTAISLIASIAALWGLSLSGQTQTALIATATTLIPVIWGIMLFLRRLVTPAPKAEAAVKTALELPAIVLPAPAPISQRTGMDSLTRRLMVEEHRDKLTETARAILKSATG